MENSTSKIVLYTIHCNKCNVLEKKLNNAHIPYSVVEGVEPIEARGYSQAPLLEVDNKIYDFVGAVHWMKEMGV